MFTHCKYSRKSHFVEFRDLWVNGMSQDILIQYEIMEGKGKGGVISIWYATKHILVSGLLIRHQDNGSLDNCVLIKDILTVMFLYASAKFVVAGGEGLPRMCFIC